MAETREVHDPFTGQIAKIKNDLVERLRGKYACGPTLPNGEPEFGWRQYQTVPIQLEAAEEIERLRAIVQHQCGHLSREHHSGGWTCPTCGAHGTTN